MLAFGSCKKEISEQHHQELIGNWNSNLGNNMHILESGGGWFNGDFSRKVWVQNARPKLIFAGELNGLSNRARTTFFIELGPISARDTLFFEDFIIPSGQQFMKLINEDLNEEYFRRDSL